jgi:tetratricopeptide (TPR) repeat protein
MKTTALDADEYFHLALHASSVGEHHACMSYLAEVLQQQPAHARALYLRAVQHSELGLTERALSGIRSALAIEPGLEIARFHLGLLLLFDRNRPEEAKEYLGRLLGSADHSLRTYAEAMIAFADGDKPQAREKLALGLAQTSSNQPMTQLMKRLLDAISEPGAAGGEAERGHMLLGAYRGNSS